MYKKCLCANFEIRFVMFLLGITTLLSELPSNTTGMPDTRVCPNSGSNFFDVVSASSFLVYFCFFFVFFVVVAGMLSWCLEACLMTSTLMLEFLLLLHFVHCTAV